MFVPWEEVLLLGQRIWVCALSVMLPLAVLDMAAADESVDIQAAQKQFMNSCGVCHTVEPNAPIRQGPHLRTVYGRAAGTLAEFPTYSDAVKKSGAGGLVWNEETLEKWISDASTFIPGSTMPYAQPDAQKRKLIIAYLKSLAGP